MITFKQKEHNEKQRIGYIRGREAVEAGTPEKELLANVLDIDERAGIHQAYVEHLQQVFKDSAVDLRGNLRKFKSREATIQQVKDSLLAFSNSYDQYKVTLQHHSPESEITDSKGPDFYGLWYLQHVTDPEESYAVCDPEQIDALAELAEIVGPLDDDTIKPYMPKMSESDCKLVHTLGDAAWNAVDRTQELAALKELYANTEDETFRDLYNSGKFMGALRYANKNLLDTPISFYHPEFDC